VVGRVVEGDLPPFGWRAPELAGRLAYTARLVSETGMLDQAQRILKDVFGYDAFRGEQGAIIERVASGGDALVLMTTGGGKSLCFQVPGLLREGLTVVVSPLIALMDDQVATLEELGISAVALNSTLSPDEQREIADRLRRNEIKMLYLAPERLVQPRMLAFLQRLEIGLFAIDEADRKSTRLNSSHVKISYAVFCLTKKKKDVIINYISLQV